MSLFINLAIALGILAFSVLAGGYLARRWRMPDHGWKIGLVLLSVLFAVVVLVTRWPPPLGIDLKGGVILVYEVDRSKLEPGQSVDMDELIRAISDRINPGGQREVTVRPYGANQVEIIIPRAEQAELDRIKSRVSSTGALEFRILCHQLHHSDLIQRASQGEADALYDSQGNRLAWWVPVDKERTKIFRGDQDIATREVAGEKGEPVLEVLVINDRFDVTGDYLADARQGWDDRGRPAVEFAFNATGARKFGQLTGSHLPRDNPKTVWRLGIILNGSLQSAPQIKATIYDRGIIEGDFTRDEVKDLVAVLNAGKLPAALTKQPISELVTGPTLGRDMIEKGTFATLLSIVLVFIFMLIYYRFAGLVACMAMLLNLALILALMITIRAELTLAGFAGLVLSVGMAVDANVLIYERMREEIDRNSALRMAIRNGFHRALSAIIDSNLTTLITATVLYVVGTDQIKGFAVTLWLGVILSLYTGVFCSRVVFDVAEKQGWISRLKMMRMLTKTNIDFLGPRRYAAATSVTVIVIGLVAVFARGQGLFNIDFTGGVSVEVVFNQSQDIGEIREVLGKPEEEGGLPDLAVADVQARGEDPGTRFIINTSGQAPIDAETGEPLTNPKTGEPYTSVQWVEDKLMAEFEGGLATNSLTIESLEPIPQSGPGADPAGTGKIAPVEPGEKPTPTPKPADDEEKRKEVGKDKPAPPPAEDQGLRTDLPPDRLLAMAGGQVHLLVAQTVVGHAADDKAEAKSDEPDSPEPGADPQEEAGPTEENGKAEPGKDKPVEEDPANAKPRAKEESEPGTEGAPKPSEAKPKSEVKPALEAPAEKPSEEPPAKKPAEEKPSEERPGAEKPAEEKPPTEKPEPKPKAPSKPEEAVITNPFAGGTMAKLAFNYRIDAVRLEQMLADQLESDDRRLFEVNNPEYEKGTGSAFNDWTVKLRLPEDKAREVLEGVNAELQEAAYFPSSSEIGGKVASSTRVQAATALAASLVFIVGYIWIRFQRLVYGLAAVVSLLHDVLITLGAVALTYWLAGFLGFLLINEMKIGLDVLAAFLTLIGYSLNDTIVIFDRIREVKGKSPYLTESMVNKSVNETLSRTIITGGGALLGLLVLFIAGGQGIHAFAFTMLFGVITGTFSSVYIASPVLLWLAGSVGHAAPATGEPRRAASAV